MGRLPEWYAEADRVRAAAEWWCVSTFELLAHPQADWLIHKALIGQHAEREAAKQRKALETDTPQVTRQMGQTV
jgi:hypothetical protein